MISAVTATGSLKYDIVAGILDADKFVDVASTSGQLRFFRLPSYSPELNPGRSATTGPDDFTTRIITALERLTQLPNLIRAFSGDSNLHYITT
jgi:hypothetical protein